MDTLMLILAISLFCYLYFWHWSTMSKYSNFYDKPAWMRFWVFMTQFRVGRQLHSCKRGRADRTAYVMSSFYLGALSLNYRAACPDSSRLFTGIILYLWPSNFSHKTFKAGDKFWDYSWKLGWHTPLTANYCQGLIHISE